jgi:hypothetical protein
MNRNNFVICAGNLGNDMHIPIKILPNGREAEENIFEKVSVKSSQK